MDNIKNNIYYIQKIRKDLEFIVEHMRDVSMEELNVNEAVSYTHLDVYKRQV